jgi:thiol-disulfide isomerase/thioredoxin
MATSRITMRLLAGLTLYAGFGIGPALALPPAPKAEDLAQTQPTYPGVPVSTPAPADAAKCRVENVPGPDGKPIGHVLLDANNRVVRRFLAVGTPNYNIKSFYLDGQEVYRETDANGNGKPDQYRWLGSNGSKWGLDPQETGRVASWARISPEEVSKELFEAIVAKDAKRVEALLPTDPELKALGLPQAEIDKVKQRTAGAAQKVIQSANALNLTAQAKWVHVELTAPQTTPADAFGGSQDVIRHRNAGVLVDKGEGKAEVFQTGELLLIGNGWRVIDGPAPGAPNVAEGPAGAGADAPPPVPDEIKEFVKELTGITEPKTAEGWPKFHTDRAAVLEKVVAKLQGNPAQEQWLRQLLDSYASAADAGVKPAADRLAQWKGQIDRTAPKSPVAGFATFRTLTIENNARMKAAGDKSADIAKAQGWWKEQLEAFVKDFPTSEEAPEAMFRLAMAHEFSGKDGEAPAKQWYARLAKDFPQNPLAPQAAGAVRRLDSEGQPLAVGGPSLTGGPAINLAQMKDKVVIVYFWASWMTPDRLKEEATFLTDLMKKNNAKGLEVVTVCMDANPQEAVQAINATQLPGVHIFQPGNGPATQYGVMGPHIFLVGKDGKVTNKNAQVPALGDEVEKMLK